METNTNSASHTIYQFTFKSGVASSKYGVWDWEKSKKLKYLNIFTFEETVTSQPLTSTLYAFDVRGNSPYYYQRALHTLYASITISHTHSKM